MLRAIAPAVLIVLLLTAGTASAARRVVVMHGDPLPGSTSGETFDFFANAVINSRGQVAFVARESSGIYSAWVADRGGVLHRRFADGDLVSTYTVSNTDRYVPFLDENGGLFATAGFTYAYAAGTGLAPVIGQGDMCPNGLSFSFAFDRHRYNDSGNLLINDGVCSPFPTLIFFGGALGSADLLVPVDTVAPGFEGSSVEPVIREMKAIGMSDDGTSWFEAIVSCVDLPICHDGIGSALMRASQGMVDTLFRFREQAPGFSAGDLLAGARAVVASNVGAAFVGEIFLSPNGGTEHALYVVLGSSPPQLIAKTGDPVPGLSGATFAEVELPNNDGQIYLWMGDEGSVGFGAALAGAPSGFGYFRWNERDGLSLVAIDGPSPDPSLGRMDAIEDFTMSPAGRVAFVARLPDQGFQRAVFIEDTGGAIVASALTNTEQPYEGRADPIAFDGFDVAVTPIDVRDTADRQMVLNASGQLAAVARRSSGLAVVVIDPEPPKKKVRVVGLEVVQAVQSWSSTVALVAGKPAFMRVHVEADEPTRVKTRVRARRGGVELARSPFEGTSFSRSAVADSDASRHRALLGGAMYFELPPEWWRPEGEVELEVEIHPESDDDGLALECRDEAAPAHDDCMVTARFERVPPLELKLVRLRIRALQGLFEPPLVTRETVRELLSILPISELNLLEGSIHAVIPHIPAGGPDNGFWLRAMLALRAADGCGEKCRRIYYGYYSLEFSDRGGLSNETPGHTAVGAHGDQGAFRYRHAHELGHLLGQLHRVNAEDSPPIGHRRGACGERAIETAPDWPYFAYPHGRKVAVLSDLAAAQMIQYGFDLQTWKVIDPHDHYELMSYCVGYMGAHRWISGDMSKALQAEIGRRFPSPATIEQQRRSYGVVRVVGTAGDPRSIERVFRLDGFDVIESPPSGPLTLELRNAAGTPVRSIPFAETKTERDVPEDGIEPPPFYLTTFAIPVETAYDQIVVFDGATELARRDSSPNAPSITVTYPNGGERFAEDAVAIAWTASDPDGDDLTFDVSASADDGMTWTLIAANVSDRQITVDRDVFESSARARVRVAVSDGFRTASDESDGAFTVRGRAPFAIIQRPTAGALVIRGETVFLVGSALGRRDIALSWHSDRDGLLARGSTAAVSLSEGDHRLVLRATDAAGEIGEEEISIRVAAGPPSKIHDLVVSAHAEPAAVRPGDGVVLTFAIDNAGPDDVVSAVARVELASALGAGGAPSSSRGSCTVDGASYRCELGAIARGDRATITAAVRPVAEGSFESSARLELDPNDPVAANNSARARVRVSSDVVPAPADAGSGDVDAGAGDGGSSSSGEGGGGCACSSHRAEAPGWSLWPVFVLLALGGRSTARRRSRATRRAFRCERARVSSSSPRPRARLRRDS